MTTCTCQTDSEDAILFCFCRGTVCYLLAVDLYLPVWENSDGRPGSYILNCLNIVIYGAQNLTVYASTKVHEFSEQNFYFNLLYITLVNFSTYVILILSTPNDIIYIELAISLSQEILIWYIDQLAFYNMIILAYQETTPSYASFVKPV